MASRTTPRLFPGGDAPSNGTYHTPLVLTYTLLSTDTTVALFSANCPFPCRVIDCYVVMNGAGDTGDKVKLTDGTNDITDDLDVSSAGDTDILRVGEIDNAYWDLAKDDTLSITSTSGALADVFVTIIPI